MHPHARTLLCGSSRDDRSERDEEPNAKMEDEPAERGVEVFRVEGRVREPLERHFRWVRGAAELRQGQLVKKMLLQGVLQWQQCCHLVRVIHVRGPRYLRE